MTSWMYNTDGTTAQFYTSATDLEDLGEEANIQQVCYDNDNIYVATEGLAEIMGPCGNPGNPAGQDHVWIIPRNAQEKSGTKTEAPTTASLGVLINGVPVYALSDAKSYDPNTGSNEPMGDGIWNGDAYYSEGSTLDDKYGGHPQPIDKEYHSHAVPTALYEDTPTNEHSPLVGWSFDGFPIYGPYGYSNANDASSSIKLIESGYELRNITQRHSLPDGTTLSASEYGPNVNGSFPLGIYIEDYEFTDAGDLDEYNGRTCVTPEFPNGTYAYFVTMESDGTPVFPYYIGTSYYGVVEQSNFGSNGGRDPMPNGLDCYDPTAVAELDETGTLSVFPNPSTGIINFAEMDRPFERIDVLDLAGRVMASQAVLPTIGTQQMNLSDLPAGIYVVRLTGEGIIENKSVILH